MNTNENMSHISGTKYCKFCGTVISYDAVVCTSCGRQVEVMKDNRSPSPQVIINNTNTNTNVNSGSIGVKLCNKWVSFCLCLFLGFLGAHKFYEGKAGMGILYLFTVGLFGIGWFIDLINILLKPNPYAVY